MIESSGTANSGEHWIGPLYLDSSALVKIYFPEPGSEELEVALQGRSDLVISDLVITEIISALSRRRREGSIRAEIVRRVHNAVLRDVEAGYYRRTDLYPAMHREAERILMTSGDVPLRAADALHLALARASRAETVVTYDLRMAAGAKQLGLSTHPRPSGEIR
jgi:hypothetical protein